MFSAWSLSHALGGRLHTMPLLASEGSCVTNHDCQGWYLWPVCADHTWGTCIQQRCLFFICLRLLHFLNASSLQHPLLSCMRS